MKKVILLALLLACMLSACGQKEVIQEAMPTPTQEITATQKPEMIPIIQTTGGAPTPTPLGEKETKQLIFEYEKFGGYVEDIAVADDGTVYAVCLCEEDKQYLLDISIMLTKPVQLLYAFNKEGECLWQMDLMFPIFSSADLGYLTLQDTIIEWSDGFLYMVLTGVQKIPVLYRLNPETWEWQELYHFEKFSIVNNLVFMEDRLYVHGILANPGEKKFVQNPEYVEQYEYHYKGQAIGYMDMDNLNAGVTLLPIDVPEEMIKLDEDTLGIYQTGDKAWSLWKYMPAEEKWEKTPIAVSYYRSSVEEVFEVSPICRDFVGYEDGCFYIRNSEHLCYETPDGMKLLKFEIESNMNYLEADGTFLYYYYHIYDEKGICRIRISDLVELFTTEE